MVQFMSKIHHDLEKDEEEKEKPRRSDRIVANKNKTLYGN